MASQQQIVVQKNAPNWPAMVAKRKISTQSKTKNHSGVSSLSESKPSVPGNIADIKNNCVASSLWLSKKYGPDEGKRYMGLDPQKTGERPSQLISKPSPFAPKVVRQCSQCQILYSNFHMCSFSVEEESK